MSVFGRRVWGAATPDTFKLVLDFDASPRDEAARPSEAGAPVSPLGASLLAGAEAAWRKSSPHNDGHYVTVEVRERSGGGGRTGGLVRARAPALLLFSFPPTPSPLSPQVEFTAAESEADVAARVAEATTGGGAPVEAVCRVSVAAGGATLAVAQAPAPAPHARLEQRKAPGGAAPPDALARAAVGAAPAGRVRRVKACGGAVPAALAAAAAAAPTLTCLHLTHCALVQLPDAVCGLTGLTELRVCHNKLATLPRALGALTALRRLHADHNALTALPASMTDLVHLTHVSLEGNKLATPLTDVARFPRLASLHLDGNPLSFLPDLGPAARLRSLSAAGARLRADAGWTVWRAELAAADKPSSYLPSSTASIPKQLEALWTLVFRRAACRHRLLAGGLAALAGDPAAAAAIAAQPRALPQLALTLLSADDDVVLAQTALAAGRIAGAGWVGGGPAGVELSTGLPDPTLPPPAADPALLPAAEALLASPRAAARAAGGRLVAGLAAAGGAAQLAASPAVLAGLAAAARDGAADVQAAGLDAIAALALAEEGAAAALRSAAGLLPALERAASSGPPVGSPAAVAHPRTRALRALAALGARAALDAALRTPARPAATGVRVLALDGGGMKGLACIRALEALAARLGPDAHVTDYFDLVAGTSTGAIIAAALAARRMTLAEVTHMYKHLGAAVFRSAAAVAVAADGAGGAPSPPPTAPPPSPTPAAPPTADGWRDSLARAYASGTRSMRVAVYGAKHDAALFEAIVKRLCAFSAVGAPGSDLTSIAASGAPRLAIVATLASVAPATPFVFRTYAHAPPSNAAAAAMGARPGTAAAPVWAALRASSAAPYYLDDFRLGRDRFQDGATTANNPALVALQEARLLWPGAPIAALVSVGPGAAPRRPRPRAGAAGGFGEAGAVLIESATSVRGTHDALATLAPLVPGMRYYRVAPVDARCAMELDETDEGRWAALEAAADEYLASPATASMLDDLASLLTDPSRGGGVRCAAAVAAAARREAEKGSEAAAPAATPRAHSLPVALADVGPPADRPGVLLVSPGACPEHDAAYPEVAAAAAAAAAAAGAGPTPRAALAAADVESCGAPAALASLLAASGAGVGVVVLGLHSDGRGGLAASIARGPAAFDLPSPAADAALTAAGGNVSSGDTLLALAASHPAGLRGARGAALALAAATPTSLLFRSASPASSLGPEDGDRPPAGCLAGQVVVVAAPVGGATGAALVAAGAGAVVFFSSPLTLADAAAAAGALVRALTNGEKLTEALGAAVAAAPAARGALRVAWPGGPDGRPAEAAASVEGEALAWGS